MESRQEPNHYGGPLTHFEEVRLEPDDRQSDRREERTLVEVEEQIRRLQQLVCELLTTNEQLRFAKQ
jgi:hypothetical protein